MLGQLFPLLGYHLLPIPDVETPELPVPGLEWNPQRAWWGHWVYAPPRGQQLLYQPAMSFPGHEPSVTRASSLEEEVEILSLFDISGFLNVDNQLKKQKR